MNFTALIDIEACPRRWALGHADYPALWSGRGYPPRFHTGTLSGTVVHLGVELITRALVSAGCNSVSEPAAFQVLQNMGGFTAIIGECVGRALQRVSASPRSRHTIERTERHLRAQIPELRTRTQSILSGVKLPPVDRHAEHEKSASQAPLVVTSGVFPELQLRARRIGWKGKVDLLVVADDSCEIVDFKTGDQSGAHLLQMRVYALLWKLAEDVNPSVRLADRLTLRYPNVDVEVPAPTGAELDALEREIIVRTQSVRDTLVGGAPEARPSIDNCKYCDVRQLCDVYWKPETQQQLGGVVTSTGFADIEVTIVERHGSSSWDARVALAPNLKAGDPLLLRINNSEHELHAGNRVRILGAQLVVPDAVDPESPAIANLGVGSEVFHVSI